jgi:hypothetical protein
LLRKCGLKAGFVHYVYQYRQNVSGVWGGDGADWDSSHFDGQSSIFRKASRRYSHSEEGFWVLFSSGNMYCGQRSVIASSFSHFYNSQPFQKMSKLYDLRLRVVPPLAGAF